MESTISFGFVPHLQQEYRIGNISVILNVRGVAIKLAQYGHRTGSIWTKRPPDVTWS